ncbi:Sugar efflux transporter [compost metagenome]
MSSDPALIRPKLWTKNFVVLSSINFFVILIFFLLNATITLYAIDTFHASSSQAGLVAGIFIIGSLLGRLFIGSRNLSRKTLIACLVFFALTTLLYFVEWDIGFLILVRLLNGFTVGVVSTIVSTIVVFGLPASRRGEGISYFAVSTALATGIGPFIGLYMTQNTGFQMIFAFCALLGVVNLIVAWLVTFPAAVNSGVGAEKGCRLSSLIEPKVLPIAVTVFVMTFCFSGIVSYLNVYALELGLVSTASFFFMVYTVFVLISRPFTGKLTDRKSPELIMYPAFALYASGLLLLSSAAGSISLLIAAALVALGFGNISSVAQASAISRAEPHRVGLATATFFLFYDLGSGLGPTVMGLIIPLTGYKGLYFILGFVVLAVLLLYGLTHFKRKQYV